MTRIAAFMNQKGGVGKTTTAVNVGSLLAHEHGKNVLLIDLDPQGNLSDHLGLDPNHVEFSIYNVLIDRLDPRQAIRRVHGLEVLPANLDLSGAEVELAVMDRRENRLREALADTISGYDYVLMDCPPSLGLLTISGLALSDQVVVPMEAEYLALRGVSQLLRTVELVKGALNPRLIVGGVIFCMYDGRTTLAKEVRTEIENYFPGKVYATPIRKNVRLAEAPSRGLPVDLYDPGCAGTADYREAAKEFLFRAGDTSSVPGSLKDTDTPISPEALEKRGRQPQWR